MGTLTPTVPQIDPEFDLTNSGRGVWLVKIPKYVASKWEQAPGDMEVGKLNISRVPGKRAQVQLSLSESVLCLKEPGEPSIPKEHILDCSTVTRQCLGVFSHDAPTTRESFVPEPEKRCMEGRIVQKLDCRPYADKTYYKLKCESMRKPQRKVQQLDKVPLNFKPVSKHKHNILYQEQKKAEDKKFCDDKESVLNVLYSAFEKHQYYNINILQNITKQPIVYLKEILKEVCNYNTKNPHKNMWELKPQYIHYKKHTHANTKEDNGNPDSR